MTYNEASALAYLRQANRDESVIAALNALLSAQPAGEESRKGTTAWHLLCAIQHIEESSPELAPELDAIDRDPNNGRGEFDRQSAAMPLWMSINGAVS